jgi:hypothetical protein
MALTAISRTCKNSFGYLAESGLVDITENISAHAPEGQSAEIPEAGWKRI